MSKKQEAQHEARNYAHEIGTEYVTLRVAKAVFRIAAYTQEPVLLIGESAIGKTDVIQQEADANGYRFVMYNLAHCDASDLTGPMFPDRDGVTFKFLRDGRIPVEGHEGSDEKVLLVLDEINRADMSTLNAAFPIWAERRVGPHKLGKNVIVVAAMNPPDGDYAVTGQFSSDPAMRRRVCQVPVQFSSSELLGHARDPGKTNALALPELDLDHEFLAELKSSPWHPAVVEFLGGKPDAMFDTQARAAGKIYSNPAVWERVSRTMKVVEHYNLDRNDVTVSAALRTKIAGNVGITLANEFLHYYEKEMELLQPRDILYDYKPKSATYKKVAKIIKNGDNARLAGLVEGVVHYLFDDASDIKPEDVVAQVGRLCYDIPPQHVVTFKQHCADVTTGSKDKIDKVVAFMKLLKDDKYYSKYKVRDIEEAAKLQKEIEESKAETKAAAGDK